MSTVRKHFCELVMRRCGGVSAPMKYAFSGCMPAIVRRTDGSSSKGTSEAAAKAFDLSLEPKESFDAYNTGRFGQGCLLARRLIEAGARFIEVTSEYIPFKYWDTHDNGHERMIELKKMIDGGVMAKGVEDTAFYVYVPLLSANEVGSDPLDRSEVRMSPGDLAFVGAAVRAGCWDGTWTQHGRA